MNEALKLARIQRSTAQLQMIERLLYNPAVEFIGGMYAIEKLFPDAVGKKITTTSQSGPNFFNPLWFVANLFGSKETTTTTETSTESNEEHWAKNALLWIIIAQQLAPVLPAVVQGTGSAVSGVAGLLTKGAVK